MMRLASAVLIAFLSWSMVFRPSHATTTVAYEAPPPPPPPSAPSSPSPSSPSANPAKLSDQSEENHKLTIRLPFPGISLPGAKNRTANQPNVASSFDSVITRQGRRDQQSSSQDVSSTDDSSTSELNEHSENQDRVQERSSQELSSQEIGDGLERLSPSRRRRVGFSIEDSADFSPEDEVQARKEETTDQPTLSRQSRGSGSAERQGRRSSNPGSSGQERMLAMPPPRLGVSLTGSRSLVPQPFSGAPNASRPLVSIRQRPSVPGEPLTYDLNGNLIRPGTRTGERGSPGLSSGELPGLGAFVTAGRIIQPNLAGRGNLLLGGRRAGQPTPAPRVQSGLGPARSSSGRSASPSVPSTRGQPANGGDVRRVRPGQTISVGLAPPKSLSSSRGTSNERQNQGRPARPRPLPFRPPPTSGSGQTLQERPGPRSPPGASRRSSSPSSSGSSRSPSPSSSSRFTPGRSSSSRSSGSSRPSTTGSSRTPPASSSSRFIPGRSSSSSSQGTPRSSSTRSNTSPSSSRSSPSTSSSSRFIPGRSSSRSSPSSFTGSSRSSSSSSRFIPGRSAPSSSGSSSNRARNPTSSSSDETEYKGESNTPSGSNRVQPPPGGASVTGRRAPSRRQPSAPSSRTPSGRTSSRTPSRTPSVGGSSSRTVTRGSSSSRTTAGTSSSSETSSNVPSRRTPSRTPSFGGSSSRTPSGRPSSRTPSRAQTPSSRSPLSSKIPSKTSSSSETSPITPSRRTPSGMPVRTPSRSSPRGTPTRSSSAETSSSRRTLTGRSSLPSNPAQPFGPGPITPFRQQPSSGSLTPRAGQPSLPTLTSRTGSSSRPQTTPFRQQPPSRPRPSVPTGPVQTTPFRRQPSTRSRTVTNRPTVGRFNGQSQSGSTTLGRSKPNQRAPSQSQPETSGSLVTISPTVFDTGRPKPGDPDHLPLPRPNEDSQEVLPEKPEEARSRVTGRFTPTRSTVRAPGRGSSPRNEPRPGSPTRSEERVGGPTGQAGGSSSRSAGSSSRSAERRPRPLPGNLRSSLIGSEPEIPGRRSAVPGTGRPTTDPGTGRLTSGRVNRPRPGVPSPGIISRTSQPSGPSRLSPGPQSPSPGRLSGRPRPTNLPSAGSGREQTPSDPSGRLTGQDRPSEPGCSARPDRPTPRRPSGGSLIPSGIRPSPSQTSLPGPNQPGSNQPGLPDQIQPSGRDSPGRVRNPPGRPGILVPGSPSPSSGTEDSHGHGDGDASHAHSVPVDNGVEGDPEVSCGPTSLLINFNIRNPFEGHVFVKGLYNDETCRVGPSGTSDRVAGIEIPFDSCNVRRDRSLDPRGVFLSATVIIKFHPHFITKVDRAVRIQCFYMEADKTVDTELEVSMLTTELRTFLVPMPVCRYEILDGGPAGDPVRFLLIGDKVYHKWTCDTETLDTFCMVVYGCYVDDGAGQDRLELLDDNGCALDLHLLPNLEYPADLMAGALAHVFKYADRPNLYFNCQINIQVKEPNTVCARPSCPDSVPVLGPRGRRRRSAEPEFGTVDVSYANPILVGDVELGESDIPLELRGTRSAGDGRREPSLPGPDISYPHFCLSQVGFGVLISLGAIFLVATLTMATLLCLRKAPSKHMH